MGLSASQARFLQLTARKSNIEYMGQQINQERLSLANESAGLFEQALSISAPNPPSSLDDEFYTPAYSFTDSNDEIVKKILVGYNSSTDSITGAVLLYDVYMPDGTQDERIEIFDGDVSGSVTGENTGSSFVIKNITYQSNVDASSLDMENVLFDEATGRLASFDYGGNSYGTSDIIYSAEFDDTAFDEAMNEYEYEKATYDYEVERINMETERIQSQDKSLELKLKKLDTEHSAIQTELDAVQKVITKNIETSFKTFS